MKTGVSIEELAEDIARRTLLQSLNVRPVLDAAGVETGMFEVPAGGRRFRALEMLVKQKRLAKTAPIPCVVRDPMTEIFAEDDSLAENLQRAPLHPLDQFRAFQAMLLKGLSEEDIAAAFFTSANVVKQRLRLASVSAKLLHVYAEDGMTLEQLMAFTVAADHPRQEQVWQTVSANSWSAEPYQIRRMLTEKTVRASDKRALFVGLEAYAAAGGTVMRDLFQQDDDGGWLEDITLLDGMVIEKLRTEAEKIGAEGWKWVSVAVDFPYGNTSGLREIVGVSADLTTEEQTALDDLNAEYAKLEAEYENAEELPDEVEQRLGEIEEVLTKFGDRPIIYDSGDITRAGVFVSIGSEGELEVDRGYVRPEDELSEAVQGLEGDDESPSMQSASEPGTPSDRIAVITIGGAQSEGEEDEDDAVKPLPDRLVAELTAHRTLALRDALADNPHVALTALLHKLVGDTFRHGVSSGVCLEAVVRHVSFPIQAPELKEAPAARSINEREEAWKADLPQDDQALWDWLAALDDASRLSLLAHCVSVGVNALYEKPNPYGGNGISQHALDRRLSQADRLARAVGLDMVEAGWVPTAENYLNRVPKRRILEAVGEGAGERAVQLIEHLKKSDMAKEAERLLAGSGWLPEPLRLLDMQVAELADAVAEESEALPEFLAGGEDTETEESNGPHAIAAE